MTVDPATRLQGALAPLEHALVEALERLERMHEDFMRGQTVEMPHEVYETELEVILAREPQQFRGYGGGFNNANLVTNDAYYAAREKSLALLKDWLSPEQLTEFERTNSFEVTGSRSKKRYRILQSTAFNVSPLGESYKLCFVPEGVDSVGDIMLAQKIMLENDEPKALAVANVQNA